MSGLFNSTTLDVILGLVFVYLLLATICTAINEWLAGIFNTRARNLASGIEQLLDGQPKEGTNTVAFLQEFYAHPLISGMLAPGKSGASAHPSYLPARTFATAVMDLATPAKPGAITFTDLESGIKSMPPGDVKTALLALIQNAHNDVGQAQKNIESWFNDTMDRASGWYKRRTEVSTVIIAALLTVGANADTVNIVRALWQNPTQRALLVQKAEKRSSESAQPTVSVKYENKDKPLQPTSIREPSKDELQALSGVLGWRTDTADPDAFGWLQRLLGWFLTIVAVSLGAPFWFGVLNKIVNIRNAGKKPSTGEPSPSNGGGATQGSAAQGAINAQAA
jgi:hypothetical protein